MRCTILLLLVGLCVAPQGAADLHAAGRQSTDGDAVYTRADIAQSRDLSVYRRLGPLTARPLARAFRGDCSSAEREREAARRFIVECIEDRARGYVIVNADAARDSIDASKPALYPITLHLFIEADATATWGVVWRAVNGAGDLEEDLVLIEPRYVDQDGGVCNGKPQPARRVLRFRSARGATERWL